MLVNCCAFVNIIPISKLKNDGGGGGGGGSGDENNTEEVAERKRGRGGDIGCKSNVRDSNCFYRALSRNINGSYYY